MREFRLVQNMRPLHKEVIVSILLFALILFPSVSPIVVPKSANATPAGTFEDSKLAGGLKSPAAMEFSPDGRLFVAERDGNVRVIKDGALLDAPFLSVPTDTCCERGLLGITLDPNFSANGFVYVYYAIATAPIHNRVSRFTADPANPDIVLAGSEKPILDLDNLNPNFHNGGALHFGKDGKLYVAAGDNYNSENSQSLGTVLGKILRINSDGTIPLDNPFYNTTGARKEVWALGVRNPFTFAFSQKEDKMYINDVGEDSWEEINLGKSGANYGWPKCEGYCSTTGLTDPIYVYPHNGTGKAITGGAFYEASQFPAEYNESYFFGDYVQGFIKRLTPDGRAVDFLQDISSPLDIDVGPDGSLYYLSYTGGEVHKVRFVAEGENRDPIAVANATTPASGPAPLTVTLDASKSSDPDNDFLTNTWDFGDGSAAENGTSVTHTYNSTGHYTAKLTASDGKGGSSSASIDIQVGNPPTGRIGFPASGTRYNAGDTIVFGGSGHDNKDGELPASAFNWRVLLHHNTHTHPFLELGGVRGGSFTIPKVMEADSNVWFRIYLTVTNSAGLSNLSTADVLPNTVTVNLDSNIPGMKVNLDGQPKVTPYTFIGVTGVTRTLQAPAETEQAVGGSEKKYVFGSWSDVGSLTHAIDTPLNNATFAANYLPANSTITVVSKDLNGKAVPGMWADITSPDGIVLQAGSTPFTFWGNSNIQYRLSTADFSGIRFDHWENGGVNATRTAGLNANSNSSVITAYYNTSSVVMGVTPITYSPGTGGPALTVNAVSAKDNSTALNMWSLIRFDGSTGSSSDDHVVSVTVLDYGNITFSRWWDGNTERSRDIHLSGNATMTAYYRTG